MIEDTVTIELSNSFLEPFDYWSSRTGAISKVFPAGTRIDWNEYNALCQPSDTTKPADRTLDIWHAAADSEGVIWLGANCQIDLFVRDALKERGREVRDDISIQMQVHINNKRRIFSISVPGTPRYITEEAAHRILEMLPQWAKEKTIQISGSYYRKILGDPHYTVWLPSKDPSKDKLKFESQPNVVKVEIEPKREWDTHDHVEVTYLDPNYPDELSPEYRKSHPELKRMGIWEWNEMVSKKERQKDNSSV